jgi:hypothetical protein
MANNLMLQSALSRLEYWQAELTIATAAERRVYLKARRQAGCMPIDRIGHLE